LLPRLAEGARTQRRRRHLGVVPDAEPCPPDARAADAGCPAPDAVGGASPLFADGEFPSGLARLSVAGPLCILSPGRGACAGRGALYRAQSGRTPPGPRTSTAVSVSFNQVMDTILAGVERYEELCCQCEAAVVEFYKMGDSSHFVDELNSIRDKL